jgi:tricorn protease
MRRSPLAAPAVLLTLSLAALSPAAGAAGPVGYYRQPAIHGDTIVFGAEGDLWRVAVGGGEAARLTSAPGPEEFPVISPDGATVAFRASYEGPTEIYTMPLAGGLPVRRTWSDDGAARPVGWRPDGRLLIATSRRSTLPEVQLVMLDIARPDAPAALVPLPLAQAADGVFGPDGTLYFTRLPFQGSHTKRYQGGTAQTLWSWRGGDAEATPLTADWPGTSKAPMWWHGRVVFVTDRDGTQNLWSMDPDGSDLRQLTHYAGWDVASPALDGDHVVYQLGADLHLLDLASDRDETLAITLASDLDQTREHWIAEPFDYLTAAHLAPDGERVALTARGEVFVAPRRQGRLVTVTRTPGVRYRAARFLPDGKGLVALSDESGEVELWRLPANGVGAGARLTGDGDILRWEAVPSPDGRYIAHDDKKQRLFLYDTKTHENRLIDRSRVDRFRDLAWSPDGRWLAYVATGDNLLSVVRLYGVTGGQPTTITSERFDSSSPAWSADGKWLWFLSDRHLESVVPSPWGSYAPEPFLDRRTEIFQLALVAGERSPFAPGDELHPAEKGSESKGEKKEATPGDAGGKKGKPGAAQEKAEEDTAKPVRIDLDGLAGRIERVPVPPGNYESLGAGKDALFWLARAAGEDTAKLQALALKNDPIKVETVAEDLRGYELSADRQRLLLRQVKKLLIVDAKPEKAKLDDAAVDLSAWRLSVVPREEWRQMFREAWRLERDYFYDPGMHGVDWPAMLAKYQPLVDRVTSREELSDLVAQMVSELSALHIFVRGGDRRQGPDEVEDGFLGAAFARDEAAGGWRIERIYRADPEHPERVSPLARPAVAAHEGDVVTRLDGVATLSVPDLGVLLRQRVGRQVLATLAPAGGANAGPPRDVIVEPISAADDRELRYADWELSRRERVEKASGGRIGYLHLRAMGGDDFTAFAEGYYPVFDRQGLILDVRHNRGGNIDSWILSRLLRKVWFYWTQPVGSSPTWNMQMAFRGHLVVLCDERTASDGEAFTEGFRRLGLGKVIGTRTWGGEIWLSSSNTLVDGGIATAAEYGVYGPQGEWLIEGHGVDPDMVVDNLPHATFEGADAQLEAAIAYLEQQIAEHPVPPPPQPPFPVKAFPPR